MVSKKAVIKENEDLKQKLGMQNLALVQIGLDKREMFMSPNDFIITPNQKLWSKIKVTLDGKDVTPTVSKVVFFGPLVLMKDIMPNIPKKQEYFG